MVAVRRLSIPPIAEAVVNFQVRLPGPMPEGIEAGLPAAFKAAYPKGAQIRLNQVQVRFKPEEAPQAEQRQAVLRGYRFESGDGRRIATFLNDQFVFSHVNWYETWEVLMKDARSAWDILRAELKPEEVHRIGLRFINKCKLKLPADSEQFLPAAPRMPAELGLDITGFTSQVVVELPSEANATVTQTIQHEADGQTYAIIDVDVYRLGLTTDPASAELWDVLDGFRDWKNRIFFAHVTEELLEPYK